MDIAPQFHKLYKILEEGYLEKQKELNSLKEKEQSREVILQRELSKIEPWRIPIMKNLWEVQEIFSHEERKQHENYVRQTKFWHALHDEAPFYRRIIDKPEGYAGDSEVMKMVYRNSFEGNTPFGMFAHKQVMECLTAQAVRNRREFLRQRISEVRGKGGGKILSIAAGPAMEIQDVLAEDDSRDVLHFHAFDHDIKIIRTVCRQCTDPRLLYFLGNAFKLIKGEFTVALPRKFFLDSCNPRKDFKGIRKALMPLKYKVAHLKKDDYTLIYSAGLYDYIHTFQDNPTKGTVALTKHLFDLLQPGGSLIIGNFSPDTPPDLRFMLDYVCDWKLIYRTKEELFDFTRGIAPGKIKNMEALKEPLGINYFLKIEKK